MQKPPYRFAIIIASVFILTDAALWYGIIFDRAIAGPEVYFLDVGQGDSSLVLLPDRFQRVSPLADNFPHKIKILIDGGPPNGKVRKNLENIFPANDRYIDMAVISHPQLDHFGGFIDLFEKYDVGILVVGPAAGKGVYWEALRAVIEKRKIPVIVLSARSTITYGESQWEIISPDSGAAAKDINDLALVMKLESGGISALFTGDIGANTEVALAAAYDIDVDILKVSHHGSRFSSNGVFLKEVSPLISAIEVGKNSYGHPTEDALRRLAAVSSQIYRTDANGLIKVAYQNQQLKVFSER